MTYLAHICARAAPQAGHDSCWEAPELRPGAGLPSQPCPVAASPVPTSCSQQDPARSTLRTLFVIF